MAMWDSPTVQVVAAAKGYGPAWASVGADGNDLVLRLAADDVPVRGRVLDLQGRPVAGASVRVGRVTVGGDEHQSLWQPSWAGMPGEVTTGRDGRFTLTGVGRDRAVLLHVEGPGIEHKTAAALTAAAPAAGGGRGPSVEVIAGPAKPVEGTVRAGDTGKPLAGVGLRG
jgi:hypothetical protein